MDRRWEILRWVGLVTAIWVQSISGNNYTFSNYSDALKKLMGLTQLELNNLSVAKDLGKAFGILAGLASDALPPSLILLIGSLEGLLGYGVQWLVVSRTISPLPYWQMCVALCMGGNSTTWMNTAVLVTCMRNFRRNRGPVSGILKGYVGLSTAIFTDLCAALFTSSPSSFLLMLSLVPLVVCCTAMLFLREVPQGEEVYEEESRFFGVFSAIAMVIAFYLLAFDLFVKRSDVGGLVSRSFALGLLVLLALPLCVPVYMWARRTGRDGDMEASGIRAALVEGGNGSLATAAEEEEGEGRRRKEIGEDHNVVEVVRTVEFWVLFLSFLCGVGTGMAVQNNMGQMGVAMGYVDVSTFVSLISIFGFFGRIGSGIVSEHFLEKSATPRPIWNAASMILMIAGYLVMALGLPGSLYIGSIVVGLCYGVRLAITVPTASELFGLKYYGLIYNILILNLPLGSFLFSGLLAGFLYDAEATKTADGGNTCVGAHCYRMVFLIMALVSVIGFVLDLLLVFRTKTLYKKICASKRARKALL